MQFVSSVARASMTPCLQIISPTSCPLSRPPSQPRPLTCLSTPSQDRLLPTENEAPRARTLRSVTPRPCTAEHLSMVCQRARRRIPHFRDCGSRYDNAKNDVDASILCASHRACSFHCAARTRGTLRCTSADHTFPQCAVPHTASAAAAAITDLLSERMRRAYTVRMRVV
jgi:hypothetical protein